MKKSIINLLLCAAAIVLGVSCQKETNADNAEFQLEDCSVSADVLGTDTKVALDGTTPKWKDNDQILVLDANKKPLGGTGLFTITSGSETNKGNFSGKKYIGQTPAYAIYPASVFDQATGKFTLPTAQDGTVTTAFKSYAVMMGTVSNGNITFANVCAVLKINTGDYGMSGGEAAIKSLKVSAAASEIAGEFTPDWTNNTIAPVAGGASLDVTASAASSYANGTDVYLAIFPTSSQALTFKFTNTNNEVATVTDTFAPATNTIKGLGTAGGMEFKTPGPDPNYWVDLGMVSSNGKKMYVAKYDVKSIAENGTVTFYAPGESTQQISSTTASGYAARTDLKDAHGYPCRVMSVNEAWPFDIANNFTKSENTFTSNITGNSVSFENGVSYFYAGHPYPKSGVYGFSISKCQGKNGQFGNALLSAAETGSIRLVCETVEDIPITDIRIYGCHRAQGYPAACNAESFYDYKEYSKSEVVNYEMMDVYEFRPIIVYNNGEIDFYYFVSFEDVVTVTGPKTPNNSNGTYSVCATGSSIKGTYTCTLGEHSASFIIQ